MIQAIMFKSLLLYAGICMGGRQMRGAKESMENLGNYVGNTMQEKMEDNITIDTEEAPYALNIITRLGDCDNDVIERFQSDESSSIDHNTIVVLWLG